MDDWTVALSPGGFECQATWTGGFTCKREVPRGYALFRHPTWDEWMCMSCMVASVKEFTNRHVMEITR